MALLALSAPVVTTNYLTDPQFKTGAAVPSTTAVGANTGFTVPWVPGLVLYFVAGATAPGNVTFVSAVPALNPSPVFNMLANVSLFFGPVPSLFQNSTTGLVQVNITTTTTVAVAAAIVPAIQWATPLIGAHNPFQLNPTANDFQP